MRFLAITFFLGLFSFATFGQTPKPTPANSKAKSTASKPKTTTGKPTATVSKSKPAAQKPKANDPKVKATASKAKTTPATSKTGAKGNVTASKPKPPISKPKTTDSKLTTAAKAKAPIQKPKAADPKTNTTASKPKPAVVQPKKPDEKAEWEKATAVADGEARIAALRKFNETFPKSPRNAEAVILIVTIATQLGNDKLATDIPGAIAFYRTAVADTPRPVPDLLFKDLLSKIPANLYFRNARDEGVEIAKAIEAKAETNAGQLLNIAAFYMSVENGAEAKRLAENAIKLDPNSSAAYQALGLANRIDFDLDESAAAYAKALELEPDSLTARRGLAEMKRSIGKPDDAVALYREILAKDEANLPANTGLVLSLFDAGKRTDAEAELGKSLEANPGNVILLAGVAYWYAAHDDGQKAIDLALKAVASDPRFIWSHIALARGYLVQGNPVAAERVLLAARRYGNFPTLEYEIASARISAGYYREAAEELAKSFSVKDGTVHTNLGGRVPRDAKNFTELIGFERRASIFAPAAAEKPEAATKLFQLLAFKQELDAPTPRPDAVAKAVDEFVGGDDRMKVHRLIFAASQLLDKKIALPKVVELAKAATANVEAGLDIPNASTAVMAGEMYENRSLAETRGEYLTVPDVPRITLSTILRGQIEELSGWATYQLDDPAEAAVRLKRAVSVLPVDSAWWRSSTWQLATALAHLGKDSEALEMYIKSYKSSGQTPIRYNVIEALYKKVNGGTDGLDARIGPNPAPSEPVAQKVEPSPTPELKTEQTPAATETKTEPTPAITEVRPEVTPTPAVAEQPKAEPTPQPTAEVKTEPTPANIEVKQVPIPTPTPTVTETPKPDPGPQPTPDATKPAVGPESSPKPTPEVTPSSSSVAQNTQSEKQKEDAPAKPADGTKELFPPVIITIPPPDTGKTNVKETGAKTEPIPTPADTTPAGETKSAPTPEKKPDETTDKPVITPCRITVSEETISLQNGGGDLAVIVGLEGDGDVEGVTASASSPADIRVRREPIEGVKARALFVIRSISSKGGVFQVKFELPCGSKAIVVKVR